MSTDQPERPDGPVEAFWTTAGVAATAATAAAFGPITHWPWWWPALVGPPCAAAAYFYARHHDQTDLAARFRALVWLAGAGWVAWTYRFGLWSRGVWAAFVAGALILGMTSAGIGARDRREQRRTEQLAGGSAAPGQREQQWQTRIARVCGVQVSVEQVTDWPQGTGYDVIGTMPPGAGSWRKIKPHEDALAADARLPLGCGVEITHGADRAQWVAHVSTVDMLGETVPYPADITPLSITSDDIPLGFYRDGLTAGANLRENAAAVVGQRGSGKTNELHVLTAGLARCPDNIVMHLDLNAGSISSPWITPWYERRAPVPAVDWVASTGKEAEIMTAFLIQVAKRRKVAYRNLMRSVDDDKVPCSPQVPAITLVVDEFAEIGGITSQYPRVKANVCELQRIGRAAGVNVEICGLRATADTIPPDVKKQTSVRIGMRVSDPEEWQYLYGWRSNLDVADAPYQGCGFIASNGEAPRPFKGWRLLPSDIDRVACAVAGWRPKLDAPSLDVPLRAMYETRWQRTLPLLFDLDGDTGPDTDRDTGPGDATVAATRPATPAAGTATATATPASDNPAQSFLDSVAHAQRALAAARADNERNGRFTPDDDLAAEFDTIVGGAAHPADLTTTDDRAEATQPDPDPGAVDRRRARCRFAELLHDAGPGGASLADLVAALDAEGLGGIPEKTLRNWLAALGAIDGGYRKWISPRHHG